MIPTSTVRHPPPGLEPADDPKKAIEGRSLRQIAWARLKRDKWTMLAGTIALVYVVIALVAPILVHVGVLDPTTNHPDLIDSESLPLPGKGGMTSAHPLGVVPGTGTDLLSRLLYGVTFSVIIGLGATIVAIVIGLVIGLVSGFMGGKTDFLASRFTELVLCFPQTLMLLALSNGLIGRIQSMGVSDRNVAAGLYVILVLGLFGWPTFARIIRAQTMSLRNREFVEVARSLGSSHRRLYLTELLPNLWAPLLIYSTLTFPTFVSAEAAIGYLGVGIQPPTPTFGNIINDSVQWVQSDPLYFFAPVIAIATLVLSFNLMGDGLRDALDPKADRH